MTRMIGVSLFAGVAFVFVDRAHAYIDLGTGNMIIQGLIGAITACVVTISIFWYRLKDFWRRLFGRNKDE